MAKELTIQEQRDLLANPVMQQVKQFEVQQRMAQMYTSSTIVPETYRGNLGNCVIAIDMAMRMGTNPLMTMQNLYIVHGQPAWSTKFLVACVNNCGRFTPLRYQYEGKVGTKERRCRAYAYERTDTEHKEPLYGTWISLELADKEGWTKKTGSKWLTMPEQMLAYRAAAFWSRIYAPEISMGFPTREEVIDGNMPEDVTFEEVTEPTPTDSTAEPAQERPKTPADAIKDAIAKQAEKMTKDTKSAAEAVNEQPAENANKAGAGTIFGN